MTHEQLDEVLTDVLDTATHVGVIILGLGVLAELAAGEPRKASLFAFAICMVVANRLAGSIAFHYVDRWRDRAIERIRRGGP